MIYSERRQLPMRANIIFGSLVLSVALCGQGFAGELAARLLGLDSFAVRSCDTCGACEPGCKTCAPATGCEPDACAKPCRFPMVGKMFTPCREKACCEEGCDEACKPRWTPVRDLLDEMKDLLCCRRCRMTGCEAESCGGCGYSTASDGDVTPAPAPTHKSPTHAPSAPQLAPAPVPVPDAAPIPPAPSK
jgi:hypothetical protein